MLVVLIGCATSFIIGFYFIVIPTSMSLEGGVSASPCEASIPDKNHLNGFDDDAQVQPEGAVFQIVKIVL